MLRFIIGLYLTGIVVFFVLFLIFAPTTPFINVVVDAVLWPWGVYKHFIEAGGGGVSTAK